MIRHVLPIAIAVCLAPTWAAAQTTVFTISAARAEVRTSPSIVSPVVGEAPRGSVLVTPIRRRSAGPPRERS